MIETKKLGFCLASLCISFNCFSQSNSLGTLSLPDTDTGDAFNQVKKMLGTWQGELTQASGNVVEQYSEFYLVSGGNTIYERIIEDGIEMHTTYTDVDGKLLVRHYCALGTQPEFEVESLSMDKLSVKLASDVDYTPADHSFVNSMAWTFNDGNSDSVTVDSSVYVDGEMQVQQAVINRIE